jgi:hypothetical protein
MIAALVFAWGIHLGYPYKPPTRIWLESGGHPSFGVRAVTSKRPVLWAKVSWGSY